jgi:hypothetical protein
VPKRHVLHCQGNPFSSSPYLQEKLLLVGQQEVYAKASNLSSELLQIEIAAKQIERVCNYHGERVETLRQAAWEQESDLRPEEEKVIYGMLDGSMIRSREQSEVGRDDWKEVKLGRFFEAKMDVEVSHCRNHILSSHYIAHLGGHKAFLEKLYPFAARQSRLIWLADGAKWIWDWIDDHFPDSVQILDFYHALEKLSTFAHACFKDPDQRIQWMEQQKQALLSDQVDEVIQTVEKQPARSNAQQEKKALLSYYRNNRKRMNYATFQLNGWLIGSGPIESAHRNIIQHRLKLPGQRWSPPGAQNIINLRTARFSNQWYLARESLAFAA